LVPGPDLAVLPRNAHVDVLVVDPQLVHPEAPADLVHAAAPLQDRFQRRRVETVDLEIEVLRRIAEQQVAHPTADEPGPAAGIAEGLRQPDHVPRNLWP